MHKDNIILGIGETKRIITFDNVMTRIKDFVKTDESTKKIVGKLGELIIHEDPQMERADFMNLFDNFTAMENMTLHEATFSAFPSPKLLKTLQGITIEEECAILNYSPLIAHLPFRDLQQLKSINIRALEKNMTIAAIIELFSASEQIPVAVVNATSLGKVLKALAGKGSSFSKNAEVKTHGVTFYINRAEKKLAIKVSKNASATFHKDFIPFMCFENFDETKALYEDTFSYSIEWNFALEKFPRLEYKKWMLTENGKMVFYAANGQLEDDEPQESAPIESD